MANKTNKATKTNPVLVTTAHRGVFFGYLGDRKPSKTSVVLTDCRNCGYWSADVRGFLGLAAQGPGPQCKIGPAAPRVTIYDVTSVSDCTAEAAQRWEEGTW